MIYDDMLTKMTTAFVIQNVPGLRFSTCTTYLTVISNKDELDVFLLLDNRRALEDRKWTWVVPSVIAKL